ncbi:hypothetical protein D3C80_1840200 [compost metagenome]
MQGVQDILRFFQIDIQHRLRQRNPDRMCYVFKLLGVIIPPLLHKVKQLDDDENTNGDCRNTGYRRHLFDR